MTAKYTFGQTLLGENSYRNEIVRNQLTRSMTTTFEDICDEIALAVNDVIPQPQKDGGMLTPSFDNSDDANMGPCILKSGWRSIVWHPCVTLYAERAILAVVLDGEQCGVTCIEVELYLFCRFWRVYVRVQDGHVWEKRLESPFR